MFYSQFYNELKFECSSASMKIAYLTYSLPSTLSTSITTIILSLPLMLWMFNLAVRD